MSLRWTDGNRSRDLLVGRHFTSPLQQQVWLYCVRMVVDFKTRTTFDWKIQSMKVYTNESVHQISDWRFILSSGLSIKITCTAVPTTINSFHHKCLCIIAVVK